MPGPRGRGGSCPNPRPAKRLGCIWARSEALHHPLRPTPHWGPRWNAGRGLPKGSCALQIGNHLLDPGPSWGIRGGIEEALEPVAEARPVILGDHAASSTFTRRKCRVTSDTKAWPFEVSFAHLPRRSMGSSQNVTRPFPYCSERAATCRETDGLPRPVCWTSSLKEIPGFWAISMSTRAICVGSSGSSFRNSLRIMMVEEIGDIAIAWVPHFVDADVEGADPHLKGARVIPKVATIALLVTIPLKEQFYLTEPEITSETHFWGSC